MAGDQIVDGRAAAPIRHMDAGRAGFLPEQRSGQMIRRTGTRRRERDLAGILVQLLDQLANVVGRITGICHQHVRRAHCDAQQIEILLRIVTKILEQRRIDGENADRSDQERVAVGGRLLERPGAERAIGAARLSMMTDCFTRSASFGATSRAVMSEAPPAGNGTMTVMLRSGYSAA